MNTSVNSYRQSQYTRSTQQTTRTAPSKRPDAAEQAAPQQQTKQSASSQQSVADGLTASEQQAIDQRFPEKPDLAMKLYGRGGQSTQAVNPDAVGSRLDVRG